MRHHQSSVIHPGFAAILAKARRGQRITENDFTSGAVVFSKADLRELEALTGRDHWSWAPRLEASEQSADDETAELLERLRAFRLP